MFTSSRGFPGFLQPDLFISEGFDIETAYTKSTKSTCTKSISIKAACINPSCDSFTCIQTANIRDICGQYVCIGNTSVKRAGANASAIEHQEIDLQFFSILKIKLLGN